MTTGSRLALLVLTAPVGALLLLPAAASAHEGDPFTMSLGKTRCDTNMVAVVLRSTSDYASGFTVQKDDHLVERGTVRARRSTTVYVPLARGRSAGIEVSYVGDGHDDKLVDSQRVYNSCPRKGGGWGDDDWGHGRWENWGDRDGRLPYTGPPADLMGKLATGGGLVLMGGIVWWYGSIWPRQTPDGPLTSTRTPRRRYPDLKE
ncbi:hypothetical protein ACFXJ8_30150 [Nonomuraea sp. NPDC059194]|uniref:hypothetical protein n=1 Tax=Nonomuraea sp. NPDC059194 TaxID=3346764 RepID=UPI003697C8A5